ncbi:surface antigen-domain-containing protein [Amanita rubescens]|nr:surface antigen-domain-containing protein [Amanita rubescens]
MLTPPLQNTAAPRDGEPDADFEKILQWHAARRERILRGEYQSQLLRLSELVNQNIDAPLRIADVRVEGALNTRQSFLSSLINPVLSKPANTLGDVLHTTRHISHLLNKADIFKHVEAKLERSSSDLANPYDVDVVFKTREHGRYYLNTSTELGNNEGSASATARIRNVFGGAETFEANIAAGTKTKKSFRAALSLPLTSDLNTYGELSTYGLERDQTSYASCIEDFKGIKAIVRNQSNYGGYHEFAYEAVHRHIGSLAPTASLSMRVAAGPSVKSAFSHTYVLDTRDDRFMATRGFYFRFYHELAGAGVNIPVSAATPDRPAVTTRLGLGGDATFYKAETEAQVSRPISQGISLSLALRSGILLGLQGKPTLFSDRFQIGGPTSVRAFKAFGMGPRDGPDSLGGDVHYSLGLSVISNIPKKPHWPVKSHVWVNCGQLDSLDRTRPITQSLPRTLLRPSVSAGIGLIYRFDPVRVEVNFGVPLAANKSDAMRRGVQVGIGLEYL